MLLKYDGPALEEHRMDVRDLAPALMGLADAMQVAGKLTDPETQVRLDIKASAEGSFEIQMLLDVAHEGGLLLAGMGATMIANGVTIGGAVKKAVLGAVAIAARISAHMGKPKKIETVGDGTQVKIEYPDGTVFEANNMAWAVFENGKAMTGLEKVVEPLRKGMIDQLELSADEHTETVKHNERAGFSSKYREETLSDNTMRMVLELVDIKFRKSSWRVSDGGEPYSIEIDDQDFLEAVNARRIRFGNGDSLVADVQVVQRRVNVNLRTERTIVKVHEVIEGKPHQPVEADEGDQLDF